MYTFKEYIYDMGRILGEGQFRDFTYTHSIDMRMRVGMIHHRPPRRARDTRNGRPHLLDTRRNGE